MYAVKLQTFEGPLDVLLELIEKEKMDISDISLTRVTGQFLEYIRSVQEKARSDQIKDAFAVFGGERGRRGGNDRSERKT